MNQEKLKKIKDEIEGVDPIEKITKKIQEIKNDPNLIKLLEIKKLSEETQQFIRDKHYFNKDAFNKLSDGLAFLTDRIKELENKEIKIPDYPKSIEIKNLPLFPKYPDNLKDLKNTDIKPIIKTLKLLDINIKTTFEKALSDTLNVYISNRNVKDYIPVRIVYRGSNDLEFDPSIAGGGSTPAFHTGFKNAAGQEAYIILNASGEVPVSVGALPLPSGAATEATLAKLMGIGIPEFDYLALTYVAAGNGIGEIETATFKTGGAGGTTVATLALTYNASDEIATVART